MSLGSSGGLGPAPNEANAEQIELTWTDRLNGARFGKSAQLKERVIAAPSKTSTVALEM